jgi:uncharacterized protein (TIRG00374 family)
MTTNAPKNTLLKTSIRWMLRLIGPAILAYFLYTTDFRQLIAHLLNVNWVPVLISLALYLPFIVVKSWRWNMIMTDLGMQAPPLTYSSILYMIGLFIGGATPGQSGDFIKAWYLRERGQALAPALFSILLDRLFDFMIMALLSLWGLIAFLQAFPAEHQQSILFGTLGFTALILIITPVLMVRRPRELMMSYVLRITPKGLRPKLEHLRKQFHSLDLKLPLFGKLFFATMLSATSTMVRLWLLFLAMQINIPLLPMVTVMALISILQALPISISGAGVREVPMIALLASYGYTQEQAIGLSVLFLLINIEHILIGFLVSLRYPLGQTPPADLAALQSEGLPDDKTQ